MNKLTSFKINLILGWKISFFDHQFSKASEAGGMSEQSTTWRPSLRQEQPGIWSWTRQWARLNSLCQCTFLSLFQLNDMICSIWHTSGLALILEDRTQGERGQTLLSNPIKGTVWTNDEPTSSNATVSARERGLTRRTRCCCSGRMNCSLLEYDGMLASSHYPGRELD